MRPIGFHTVALAMMPIILFGLIAFYLERKAVRAFFWVSPRPPIASVIAVTFCIGLVIGLDIWLELNQL